METHLIQGSESWKELRKQFITSTDCSVIMGYNPWKTPYKLWRQKMDLDSPDKENEAMRRGTELEPLAREWILNNRGIKCEPKVISKGFMMASLDGLSSDATFIVEIKCGEKSFSSACIGEIPNYYLCQIQHQIYCANVGHAKYLCFDGEKGIVIDVQRDQEFIYEMIEKEREFYQCLITFTPPTMTTKDYHHRSDIEWNNLAENYRNAHKELKNSEQLEKTLREQLIALAGEQSSQGAGIKLSKIPRKGNIDYSQIEILKSIDLEQYRKPGTEYWKVSVDK